MAKKQSTKPARDRQPALEGMPEASQNLREKAEDLEATRDRRQTLQTEEADLQSEVIDLMHEEGITRIAVASGRLAALSVTEPTEKVKFNTPKNE